MKDDISGQLNTLVDKIERILVEEINSTTESKWLRAELYQQGRDLCKSNQRFKEWIDSIRDSDAGRMDEPLIISKMMQWRRCFLNLNNMYSDLGYSHGLEFSKEWAYSDPSVWPDVIQMMKKAIRKNWTVRQCRDAMAQLKAELNPPKETPPETPEATPAPRLGIASHYQALIPPKPTEKPVTTPEPANAIAYEVAIESNQELTRENNNLVKQLNKKDKQIAELKEQLNSLRAQLQKAGLKPDRKRKQPSINDKQPAQQPNVDESPY